MKKYTFFLFTFCLLFNISELKSQATNEPIVRIIIQDDKGTSNEALAPCRMWLYIETFVANLDNFTINDNLPLLDGVQFSLPESYPVMDLKYSIGSISGTENLEYFYYDSTAVIDGDTINIFKHTIEIPIDLQSLCSSTNQQSISMYYDFDLIDPGESPGEEDDEPYPVCDYLARNDIFACSIFNMCPEPYQICLSGFFTSVTGTLEIDCPELCQNSQEDSPGGDETEGNSDYLISKKKTYVNIFPNPFNSTIDILIDNKDNPVHRSIEIYDLSGSLLCTIENKKLEPKSSYSLDLAHLPSSLYIVQIKRENSLETRKIWKQ